MDPAGTEGDRADAQRPEDRDGFADGRRSDGGQRRSSGESGAPAAGPVRQRLAVERTRSGRGEHVAESDPEDVGGGMDARGSGASLRAATGAGGCGGGGWRAAGGRFAGGASGDQLGGRDQRVLSDEVTGWPPMNADFACGGKRES